MAWDDFTPHFEALQNPIDGVTPDEVVNNIKSVYEKDLSSFDGVIKQHESAIVEKDKTISELQAANYKLLMKTGASTVIPETPINGGGGDPDPEKERAATIRISDLFN